MRKKQMKSISTTNTNSPVLFAALTAGQFQAMLTEASRQGAEMALAQQQVRALPTTQAPQRVRVKRQRATVAQRKPRPLKAAPAQQVAPAPTKAKRPKRTSEDRTQLAEQIRRAVTDAPGGLAKRELAQRLGVDSVLLDNPLRDLVKANALKIQGAKRAARYFAGQASNGVSAQV